MPDKKHALVSPSAAKRWLTCTPSIRLEKAFAEVADEESAYAREGTLAHLFAEAIFAQRFNTLKPSEALRILQQVQGDAMYDNQMRDYVYDYVDYVSELFNSIKRKDDKAMLLIEEQIDLSAIIPEGFGTGDAIIIGANTLIYIDLKYGAGVRVEAEDNEQALLYAYGLWDKYAHLVPIQHVEVHIYQPRIDNINSASYPMSHVIHWAEHTAKPRAELAFKGAGEFVAGEHCRFCKAKSRCRKLAERNLELAAEDFRDPELLSDDEIVDILLRKSEFTSWIKAIADHAAEQARNGRQFPGMKLVYGKADRKYANEDRVAESLLRRGFTREQIYDNKLKGIGAMEKLLGKNKFTEYLDKLVYKPTGAPTLVPVTDNRLAINGAASAARDFE